MVKHLPAMWETRVLSLDWEDPLEKEMATHSSTLAWKIPWMEEPGRLQFMESQRVRHDRVTRFPFHFTCHKMVNILCLLMDSCCNDSFSYEEKDWRPVNLSLNSAASFQRDLLW